MTDTHVMLPRLEWFKGQMLEKLMQNEHKGDPRDDDIRTLYDRVVDEMCELKHAVRTRCTEDIIRECADVANTAMMLADAAREGK